nr:hypothetical protein Q903MT_gene4580 [Picea sitchensis]
MKHRAPSQAPGTPQGKSPHALSLGMRGSDLIYWGARGWIRFLFFWLTVQGSINDTSAPIPSLFRFGG